MKDRAPSDDSPIAAIGVLRHTDQNALGHPLSPCTACDDSAPPLDKPDTEDQSRYCTNFFVSYAS